MPLRVDGRARPDVDRGVGWITGDHLQARQNAWPVRVARVQLLLVAVKLVGLFPNIGGDGHAVNGLDVFCGQALQEFGFGHDVVLGVGQRVTGPRCAGCNWCAPVSRPR